MDFSKKESVGETKKFIEANAKDVPGSALSKDIAWEANEMQAQSDTKIEDDAGVGGAIVIRQFEFGVNPEAFKQHKPTKQELFNAHYKGIEAMLWVDGLTVIPEINPKVTISKNGKKYRIFIGAKPAKGQMLYQKPQTLNEIVHG